MVHHLFIKRQKHHRAKPEEPQPWTWKWALNECFLRESSQDPVWLSFFSIQWISPQRWKEVIPWTKMEWSTLESEDLNIHFFQLLWLLWPKKSPRYHWLKKSRQKQNHDHFKLAKWNSVFKIFTHIDVLHVNHQLAFTQGEN